MSRLSSQDACPFFRCLSPLPSVLQPKKPSNRLRCPAVGATTTAADVPTALKRRQLRAAGCVLLPVPYWEWDALGSSKAAKEEYLRAAILGVS